MSTNEVVLRTLARIIPAINTSDGAGVRLRRSLGSGKDVRLDPFLMLCWTNFHRITRAITSQVSRLTRIAALRR